MTLEEALFHFLHVDRSSQTNETYRRFLSRFVRAIGPQRPLDLVTPEDLDAFIAAMRNCAQVYATHPLRPAEDRPLASTTVYRNIKMVKTFFNWCEKRGYIAQSPARFIANRKPSRPLGQGKAATDEEVELLLAAARFKPRDRAMVMVLAHSGCRAGELAALRIPDLDLVNHSALVDGKGDKRRRIYFNEETSEAIQIWLKQRPETGHDRVFISLKDGRPLSAAAVSQMLRRLCRIAGIRSIGAHSLRHRVGLKFARARIAPRVTQAYLGHSNVMITLAYYQDVDETDLRVAGELL